MELRASVIIHFKCINRLTPVIYVKFSRYAVTQLLHMFIVYLGFYVAFNTVQVISRRVVGRAEETST